jgi:hypothetical protein
MISFIVLLLLEYKINPYEKYFITLNQNSTILYVKKNKPLINIQVTRHKRRWPSTERMWSDESLRLIEHELQRLVLEKKYPKCSLLFKISYINVMNVWKNPPLVTSSFAEDWIKYRSMQNDLAYPFYPSISSGKGSMRSKKRRNLLKILSWMSWIFQKLFH